MGSLSITQSALTLLQGGTPQSMLKMKGGQCTISGGQCAVNTTAIALGRLASPATPVVVGPTGISGVGSTAIFGSP